MEVQSLSVCVPAGCPNKCKFCCAHMHRDKYKNSIEQNKRFRDLYKRDYKSRLMFARDNGCNTLIFTGDGEPLFNRKFMEDVLEWNSTIPSPFRWIEVQTSGVTMDDEALRWLRNAGVTNISLSLSDMFNDDRNYEFNGTNEKLRIPNFIEHICSEIKKYDFVLRLSLNMTHVYNEVVPEHIFNRLSQLGADQVTFRVLYTSGLGTEEDHWIETHKAADQTLDEINRYIKSNGHELEVLPFGAIRYAVSPRIDPDKSISTVIDDDCMSTDIKKTIRYMILRPDCKIYTKWNIPGSIIF